MINTGQAEISIPLYLNVTLVHGRLKEETMGNEGIVPDTCPREINADDVGGT